MPSPKGVIGAFGLPDMASISRPKAWASLDLRGIVQQWVRMLRALDDAALLVAVDAYIATGETWWPNPGVILRHAPASTAPQLTADQWHPAARSFMVAEEAEHGPEISQPLKYRERYAQALIAIEDASSQGERDRILKQYANGDHDAIAAAWRAQP